MTGQQLARGFYEREVAPLLTRVPHAAALIGDGSEVLGYDDEVSPDHDFGPRVQVFTADPDALPALPAAAAVHTPAGFFAQRLGVDPAAGLSLADWLLAPTQTLAGLTAGAVFHDPYGELGRRRDALRWYPDDVWRYALAAGWLTVAQEEAFVGRTGGTGDDLGSRILTAGLARELVRLAFLTERVWAPYGKWLGRAFTGLRAYPRLGPLLTAALAATGWREREAALTAAGEVVAAATNALGLCPPQDPAPRRYFTRDIRVVGGDRFTVALCATITDPEVRALLDRLGTRRGGPAGVLPGTVDQALGSVDALNRSRHAATLLGVAERPTPPPPGPGPWAAGR